MKNKAITGQTNYWVIIISALSAFFISSFDVAGVITEITPFIVKEFSPSAGAITLLGSISTLTMAAVMIASGSLGNIFGPRKILITGAIISVISDIGAFLFSSNVGLLIFFRALVGLGAGLSNPMMASVIMLASPAKDKPKAFGLFMVAASVSGAIRSPLIQIINTNFGWRSVFLLVAALNTICLILVFINIPKLKSSNGNTFDTLGVLLAGFGLSGVIIGASISSSKGFSHPLSLGSILIGILSLVGLILYSKRKEDPAVRISLFKNRTFAFSMLFGHFLYFTQGLNYFITIYGITAAGVDPLKMSTFGVTLALTQVLAGLLAGKIAKWFPKNLIVALGGLMVSTGLILLATQYQPEMNWGIVYLAAFIMGFGFSTANSRRMSIALDTVPDDIASSGSSLDRACSWSGISLAVSVTSSLYPMISARVFREKLGLAGITGQPITNWNIIPTDPNIIPYWAVSWGTGIRTILMAMAVLVIGLSVYSYFLYENTNHAGH